MPNNTDILLRFLLDENANRRVQEGISTINEELRKIEGSFPGDELGADFERFQAELDKTTAKAKEFGEAAKETAKAAADAASAQASVFSAQATVLNTQVSQIRNRVEELNRVSGLLGQASGVGLAVGGGIVGGIFLAAKNYSKDAEEADGLTRQWAASTRKIEESQERIGRVAAQTVLPLLQKAADVADKASRIVDKHPELIQVALNTGLIVAGFSALGLAVSRGIKLYADVKYIASVPIQLRAAELQFAAAEQQLVAAHLRAEAKGIEVAEGLGGGAGRAGTLAGALRIAGQVTLVATSVLLGAEIGNSIGNAIAKLFDPKAKDFTLGETLFFGGVRSLEAAQQRVQVIEEGLLKTLSLTEAGDKNIEMIFDKANNVLQVQDRFFQKLFLGLDIATQKAETLGGGVGGRTVSRPDDAINRMSIETQERLVEIWRDWREDDARLVREAAENRIKIIEETEKQIADLTRRYNQQRTKINERFNDNRSNIIRNFNEASQKAEIDHAKARADIVKDAGEDIRRIEEQHQENIRKMTMDHQDRVDNLTAARDALGLVKEQRKFDRDVSEAERGTNQEIAQRRRDIAIRLQELAAQYAAERAQRQAEFIQTLAENEQRRQEELKQAAAAHQEELQQAREAQAQKLRELQEALNAERIRRREVFIAEIRDLDEALLGERGLKQRYYQMMLQDAEIFLANYRAKLASASPTNPTGRATGGYAPFGIYRLGDTPSGGKGGTEFVLSANTTRAAERVIGGQLNQRAILAAMMSGGGKSITWNDHRRFDGRITIAERRAIIEDTKALIYEEMGYA